MNELLEQAIMDKKLLEANVLSFYLKLKDLSKFEDEYMAEEFLNMYKYHFKIESYNNEK